MSAIEKRRRTSFDATQLTVWQTRALAIVAAIVVNVVVLVAARLANGEYPVATVGSDDQTIGFAQVAIVTGLVGLVAWGLLALLERMTAQAKTIWTVIAGIVLVLSLLGPIGSGVGTASQVALALMHIGAAATIVPLMRRTIATRG